MKPVEIIDRLTGGKRDPASEQGRAFAAANIALCKYWGKRDADLNLPVNSSLSVSLGRHGTHVNLFLAGAADTLVINGAVIDPAAKAAKRMTAFLDDYRPHPRAGFHLETTSDIPIGAGLASSASAFAAVVMALNDYFAWNLSPRHLSILARMGSGSAARSIFHGFVEWHAGARDDGMDSFAEPLPDRWPEFRIGWLPLSDAPKKTGSRDGMNRTRDESILYQSWPVKVAADLLGIRQAIQARRFAELGALAESNAMSMHATMLGCQPPLLYWLPSSVAALHRVWELREGGLPVYVTMDAGPNVKLLFLQDAEDALRFHFPDLNVVAPF